MFRSAFSDIAWPAILEGYSASLASVLLQLEASQWWSPKRLAEAQFGQLAIVINHARRTVPFYQRRFDELGLSTAQLTSPGGWRNIPVLSRRDVQTAGVMLHSSAAPARHGTVTHSSTSGSTSQPVESLGTQVSQLFWQALTLREHFWHDRDFKLSLAAIRQTTNNDAVPPQGARFANWGSATHGIIDTGEMFLLTVRSSIHQQVDWLTRVNPAYLLAYPSVLLEIARLLKQQGRTLTQLQQLRTFGEIVEPQCRAICEEVFGVKVIDVYSSQEAGYIALQCPEHNVYHLMSENVLVEILDDEGRPCQTGEVGRVVVSTLHNFAMPLLRYDLGDYAEVGALCPCGRGLPTLRRILGRQRNLFVMPDGTRRWPVFDADKRPADLPAINQIQVIQRTVEKIDLNVVRATELTAPEAKILVEYVRQMLEYPFEISVHQMESIPRSATGKFEDFICEIPPSE